MNLKQSIPSSCFKSSLLRSLSYLARDLLYATVLITLALNIERLPDKSLRLFAWLLYGFFQGCVCTGLWILAHECGHGAFSRYPVLNDFVGWILHSLLLVPYFSWKITHARHHRYTGHMEKDSAFVPQTESDWKSKQSNRFYRFLSSTEDTPIMSVVKLVGHQLVGWQLYLLFNVTSGKGSKPLKGTISERFYIESHFDPTGPLFLPSQRLLVVFSDIGLILMLVLLYAAAMKLGAMEVSLLYLVPYLWVHHWLVAITYLHHTHPAVVHYAQNSWTFTKGALSTIDRDFGFIGRHFFHNIIDYHVVHHLFPKIPFYHARTATRAIRPLLGDIYVSQKEESFFRSLLHTFRNCNYVSEGKPGETMDPGVLRWVK
ncbi:Delta(12) fatty acid desaturase [Biscogniauxia marginata]|nr:Delta(12) fatty acid desaturase [Biscogniauxia marginata]